MDVNELAEHRLRKIDEEIAAAWRAAAIERDARGIVMRQRIPDKVHQLMAIRRQTELLILVGPRGAALVA